jgi:hypothetical protein
MRSLFCRVFPLVVLAMLVAAPAAADDAALFKISHVVAIGDLRLPAGDYTFRATPRGLVLIYDREMTKVQAAVLVQRTTLPWVDFEKANTLSHDWALRSLSLGEFQYQFVAGTIPADLVAQAFPRTTVVAQAR